MITAMKKYTMLVFHREYDEFLKKLRDIGGVHIIEKETEEKESVLKEKFDLINSYDQIIKLLGRRNPQENTIYTQELESQENILEYLESLYKELEQNTQNITIVDKEIAKLEPWGNYNYGDILKLQEGNLNVHLYSCSTKRFNEDWYSNYHIDIVNEVSGKVYFVLVYKEGIEPEIDADIEKISETSLHEYKQRKQLLVSRNTEIKDKLNHYAAIVIDRLEEEKRKIQSEIDMDSVVIDTQKEADEKLMILEGWVPEPKVEKLTEFLNTTEAYYIESEPKEQDHVPILLKNDRFSKLFEPISKLFDFPNYQELDLTPFFAPFFMLFFGFCLGDAGYGLIFILLGFLLKRKVKPELKPILSLGQYLGLATVLFGALSGTFFGINLIDTGYLLSSSSLNILAGKNLPAPVLESLTTLKDTHFEARTDFMQALKSVLNEDMLSKYKHTILKSTESDFAFLNSFRHLMLEPLKMFYLSVIIGGVQVIFGMIVKVINITKQKKFIYSLSTLGWVLLMLFLLAFIGGPSFGLYSIEKNNVLVKISFVLALGLIILFNNPDANIFLRPLNAIWDAYGIVTGVFGDLLSYIRLFALGISSAILGFVFNDISYQFITEGSFLGWIPFILLLAFGHTINLFLAALGGFIHPMRLTFVEFYKNAGFSGGGKEYKPFTNKLK